MGKKLLLMSLALTVTSTAFAVPDTAIRSAPRCEDQLMKSLEWQGFLMVGGGALLGAGYGASAGVTAYGGMMAIESTSEALLRKGRPYVHSQIQLNAVSTGTVVATAGLASGFWEYRLVVDQAKSVIQLMRDLKVGAGPQLELRFSAIYSLLEKLNQSAFEKTNKYLAKDTLNKDLLRAHMMENFYTILNSEFLDCTDIELTSMTLDSSLIEMHLQRTNPGAQINFLR